MNENIKLSIIIPTFNSRQYVDKAIGSVLCQNIHNKVEIILVDDCSTDGTSEYISTRYPMITVLNTQENKGPGIARNIGLENAKGEYVLFLDSDDEYIDSFLDLLNNYLEIGDLDVVCFDYCFSSDKNGQRYDLGYIAMNKDLLLYHYLKLHMDGSSILAAYRRIFLLQNNIYFEEGYHEDVDFMYMVYSRAQTIGVLDVVGYCKNNRQGSIVNTISKKHIAGYFRAYKIIWEDLKTETAKIACVCGIINLVAFKIRDILRLDSLNDRRDLYQYLYEKYHEIYMPQYVVEGCRDTTFFKMTNCFASYMERAEHNFEKMEQELVSLKMKTWGCWELMNSLFLGPDEIRTCCKRFFVDGIQQGDIVIERVRNDEKKDILHKAICHKRELYNAINQGEKTACDGCPYLEYKNWSEECNLYEIKKLSFEYHTCCSLRCSYCDDKYYGGKQPQYNVEAVVNQLVEKHYLDKCDSIVWGGGEPTIDRNFESMLLKISEVNNKEKQRVITNSTIYSSAIEQLLLSDKVTIVTSIDAGCSETYRKIHKKNYFLTVVSNLRKYSAANAQNIIIKYILLDENSSTQEIDKFVECIVENKLSSCSFQISCNFKSELTSNKIAEAGVYIYYKLKRNGVNIVYWDEFMRERVRCDLSMVESILEKDRNIENYILYHKIDDHKKIALCGNAVQIKNIIEHTLFINDCNDVALVAGHESYNGNIVKQKVMHPIGCLLENDWTIILASTQGTGELYRKLVSMGIDKKRICDKLVI